MCQQPALFISLVATLLMAVPSPGISGESKTETNFEKAQARLALAAENSRQRAASLSFEEFKATVYKEPFEGGKFIVNGDTTILDEKHLREFYTNYVKTRPQRSVQISAEFAIHTVGGLDAVWSPLMKRSLTYCVSKEFGARHSQVVENMHSAAGAWEQAADLDFIYLAEEDDRCGPPNENVVFDVRPVNVFGQYLARAFFPNEPRVNRNVLIDESAFRLEPDGELNLVGILRHELGHTIGARHEHTRPESGKCFEDENWRTLTDYDPFSVMHYPQCNGLGDWSLRLTHLDKNGVACVYGPAEGFEIDETICASTRQPLPQPKSLDFEDQTIELNEENRYPTIEVAPGTAFVARISGVGPDPGDPDLYLGFDGTPAPSLEYDCRPFLPGADEVCSVVVPDDVSVARVLVHGYSHGNYRLSISYFEP